jgi:hypothetical protein
MPGRPAVQAAGLGVEVAEARGQAGDAARRREGALGGQHRVGEGALEGDEATLRAAVLRKVEQALLGGFELVLAVELGLGAEGAVHHLLAHVHQLAAEPAIVDEAAVLAGVDDADHGREELRQVGGAAHLVELTGVLELGAQGDDVRELAGLHAALDGAEDAAVDRVGEVLGRQELGDLLVGLVVGEQRAEQRLFRLRALRRHALRQAEQAAAGPSRAVAEAGRHDRVHGRSLA